MTGDLATSPLRQILPFELSQRGFQAASEFEPDTAFSVPAATPTKSQRALATVYDDWLEYQDLLSQFTAAKGIHRKDRVVFSQDSHTPLLNAVLADGTQFPLVVASYPKKGRAIWVFTDSLWKLALETSPKTPREVYSQFVNAAMTWLLREGLRKPVSLLDFALERADGQGATSTAKGLYRWSAQLEGPAVPFLEGPQAGTWTVCGVQAAPTVWSVISGGHVKIAGEVSVDLGLKEMCEIQMLAEHPAFGSVKESSLAVVAKLLPDSQMDFHMPRLVSLAVSLGVKAIPIRDTGKIQAWLNDAVSG